MTKNREAISADESRQTVTVLDSSGVPIGKTYPRRAKGLVKKCRAEYASDDTIRLYADCPMYDYNNTEEHTMEIKENYIYLNPREWRVNPDTAGQTTFQRFFMQTPFESEMKETLSLGTWGGNWSEIISRNLPLSKGEKYSFVFWLNGGENDRFNEVCELHILLTDTPDGVRYSDWENRLCYKLNRSYIKPLKRYKGWELYSISFTADQEYAQLRFVAQFAPMALLSAEAPEAYAGLEDVVDEYDGLRPQRHNIVFEDGWPTNRPYATRILSRAAQEGGNGDSRDKFSLRDFVDVEEIAGQIADDIDIDEIAEQIADGINVSEISKQVADSIDMDEVAEQVADTIDMDELAEKLAEKLTDSFRK